MSWDSVDSIHRTAKILIDSGKVTDSKDARRYLESLILQVAVGAGLEDDPAAQAALATVVNAGGRAFLGGIHVCLTEDPVLTIGWTQGRTASETVTRYGGTVVDTLSPEHPTLVIGHPAHAIGRPTLYLTWHGWAAGVVDSGPAILDNEGITLAGIAAGSLGISEAFQQQLGYVTAGRRDVGISLWRPDLDWRQDDAAGPSLEYLPAGLWLLGLGHLGQAYAWTLGLLPYTTPNEVLFGLMDFDAVVEGNIATQLLAREGDVDQRKTRVVAAALERLGFRTQLVERPFDEHFHAIVHSDPRCNEPTIVLAGFDKREPRLHLGGAGFSHIVDAGLGAGPVEYLDMVLHSFPGPEDPTVAFANHPAAQRRLPQAYEDEIVRRTATGIGEAAARCGMLDIAGVTVGAAFVGAFASTIAVADILRLLHGGESYSVISIDLRNPSNTKAVINTQPGETSHPAFVRTGPSRHA